MVDISTELCGIKLSNVNDAGREGFSPSTVAIVSRPVSMFIINAGVSMIHGSWTGVSTGEEVFDMIFAVVMIIMSSVSDVSLAWRVTLAFSCSMLCKNPPTNPSNNTSVGNKKQNASVSSTA